MRVIIDTDPGTDDILALMMALNAPELQIEALTAVAGNARLTDTLRNAHGLLDYLDREDIAAIPGCSRPVRGQFKYAYHIHGEGGLTVPLPPKKKRVHFRDAVRFILDTVPRHHQDIDIIALGPLTNVAQSIDLLPSLPESIRRVFVMGGQGEGSGNVTPYAEFNIWADPHAANIVFDSGVPVTLIGLDVCRQTSIAPDDAEWFSGESPEERLAARILTKWFESDQEEKRFSMHDPLTVAAALRPELIKTRPAAARAETQDPERKGEVIADYANGGNVDVAHAVDSAEALRFMRGLLTGKPQPE